MAKYECALKGDFNELLRKIDDGIVTGSASASREDFSDYQSNNIRCAVRVYERYSMAGGNRVSLNITLIGNGDDLFIAAITSGGSQAMFYKINTLGEKEFLKCAIDIVENYQYSK